LLCHKGILEAKGEDGTNLYSVDRLYEDIHVATEENVNETTVTINHPTYLYKLNP